MGKAQLEQLAIMIALGVAAFVIWRMMRDSSAMNTLLGTKTPALSSSASSSTPTLSAAGMTFLRPTAAQLGKAYSDTINDEDAALGAAMANLANP